ncbi:MAG: 30S ribosomal protein S3ae [Thermoplasmatota archaeon]
MATDKTEQQEKSGKKKVARTSQKKVKDKWKSKLWYTVRAPKMFNGTPIAETLSDETPKLVGRIAEATLQDLTGDFSKMHIKLYFKVAGVRGTECTTKFVGHELTSDYIRRLTRRKHSKVDCVFDVTTSDGWTIRVKPMCVTENRAKSSQEQQIRVITETVAKDSAKAKDLGGFVKELVNGDLALAIYKEARKVYPLKRVEIRKSQVLAEPANFVEELDVFAPAAADGEAVQVDPAAAEAAAAEADAPVEEEMVDAVSDALKDGKSEEELVDE